MPTSSSKPNTTANGKPADPRTQKPGVGKGNNQRGNRNALRHGLRCGMLPKGAKYVEGQMNVFRRVLEEAVLAAKGEVSLVDAATIQTAVKWERHGALALRWLRVEGDNLKPVERLTFSREIAKASAERDKALKELDLDAPPKPIDLQEYLDVATETDQ